MGKIPDKFTADMPQVLNQCLHEHADALQKAAQSTGFFIMPNPRNNSFEVRNLEGMIGVFSLTELPGCCGVLVSHYSEVRTDLRKNGVGLILAKVRMEAARRQGYGQMVATVLDSNTAEQIILKNLGWVKAGEFRNPKTNHIVHTWLVNL